MKLSARKRKISIVIICLLFIFSLNFFQKEVRGFFYSISSSFQKKLWEKGSESSSFWGAILRSPELSKENKNLKLSIQELLFDRNYTQELEEENKMLREALNLGFRDQVILELSEVIGKDANRDGFLLDKGSEDGISWGYPIINAQKVMIGTISDVHKNYSKVLFISDKQSSLEVQVPSVKSSGVVKGLGGTKMLLDFIPKDAQIQTGDLVVAGDFLIGLIGEIKKEDASPFQRADISPFFNISDLSKVFIVLDF